MAGDFDAIVARMLGAVAHRSRALVAIDGVGASGKSIFTARLARSVGTYRSASYDRARDQVVQPEPVQATPDVLVLVEGTLLHRDELTEFWDYSVYLDVPFEETFRRMAARDDVSPDPHHGPMHRYVGAQRIYFQVRHGDADKGHYVITP